MYLQRMNVSYLTFGDEATGSSTKVKHKLPQKCAGLEDGRIRLREHSPERFICEDQMIKRCCDFRT